MRNLKKFLALVLAMVMAFSLMLSASAATFDDKHFSDTDKVTQEFKEAVAVLTGLDVIKGDGDGDIKDIRPGSLITRAEAAALVYRIATGDINDTQVAMYSDYSNFKDVKPRTADNAGDWFAGYVGYCQNAGIIKGTTPTTFNPYGNVTGYEVLAMILRAVGYGKQNEFTGSTWQVNVASLGKTKHITDSITSSHLNYTLNMNATREIVAELLFRGSLIKQVRWTPGLGYVEYKNGQLDGTTSLAAEVFALNREGWRNGEWGVPELVWTAGLNPTSTPRREVAVLKADYKETFHDEQRECDVAELMGFNTTKDYILFVNSDVVTSTSDAWDNRVTSNYHVVATDAVTKVGGYGRVTEIYTEADMNEQYPFHNWENYWASESGKIQYAVTAPKDTIVMVDTIVAKVMNVSKCVKDAAGHVITPARLTVALYDAATKNNPNTRVISKAVGSDKEWDYAIGDVLSLQGPTNAKVQGETAAYSTQVLPGTRADILYEGSDVVNIKKMDGVSGKQTLVYRNTNKHQVDGEDKTDDLTLKLDKALDNINTTYTWYYDDFGYVQAIDEGSANYGVITSIYAAFGTGDANTSTTGTAKAVATVKFSDGEERTVEIDRFLVMDDIDAAVGTYAKAGVSQAGAHTATAGMQETTTANSHAVELWPMYDTKSNEPLKTDNVSGLTLAKTYTDANGFLYLAPAAISNRQSNLAGYDYAGILYDNLFKFVKVANDQTVAVQVAGTTANTGIFDNNYSDVVNVNTAGKVWKNLSCVTIGNSSATPVAWIDENTEILVRNPNTGVITAYSGVSALPGDVNLVKSTGNSDADRVLLANFKNEIDWADPDEDGRAEVLYVTGTIDGQTTYGLFYYNDGAAQWNGTTGTVAGFLNGEEKTLTFTSKAWYDEVVGNTATYKGHLYAVEQQLGVVTDLMQKNYAYNTTTAGFADGSGWSNRILAASTDYTTGKWSYTMSGYATGDWETKAPISGSGNKQLTNIFKSGNDATTPANHNNNPFKLGGIIATPAPQWGNSYSEYTRAAYFEDTTAVNGTDYQLRWVPEIVGTAGTVEVRRDDNGDGAAELIGTYYINAGTKIWGLGSGVTFGMDAMEYLNQSSRNDVTMVYDDTNAGNYSVREIYIATDPNITPSNPNTPAVSGGVTTLTASNLPSYVVTTHGTPNQINDSYLKNLGVGVYSAPVDLSYNQDVNTGRLSAARYFRFDVETACTTSACSATIIIKNSSNLEVFREAMGGGSSVKTTGHYFYIDTGDAAANPGRNTTNWNTGALPAGTYTYQIIGTDASNPVVSGASGSFVMP